MTDNGSTWPPDHRDPRVFQPPQPLHHDPRDRDPRPTDPRRPGDSPWRRTQRQSRPEAAGWHSASASYHTGPGEGDTGPYRQPDGEDGYDDQYDTGGRFVPGFGDYGDEDDEDDRRGRRGRALRAARGARGARGGAGSAGSRRWWPCWSS